MRQAVQQQVRTSDAILDYIVDLVRATRERPSIAFGASPRAATMLTTASRAYAALQGRDYVLPDDLKQLVQPVLGHRVWLHGGVPAEALLQQIVERTEVPL